MGAMQLTMRFRLSVLVVLSATGVVGADWTYAYSDDFSGTKAQSDNYRHSAFWSNGAVPLPEPYLSYTEVNRNPGLAFTEYKGRLAELGYKFPVGAATAQRMVKGTCTVEVSFPATAEISQNPPGQLLCATSPDGMGWSASASLDAGRHEIAVFSPTGACYVLFTGTRAVLDNLSVSLLSSAATVRVPGDFATIQAAIDAAGTGDVIEVAPGTYSGPGNRDIDFRGKAITVRSAAGAASTTMDCGGGAAADEGHRGFYFHQAEGSDSVLSGFTIRGGRIFGTDVPSDPQRWTPSPTHPLGGGIYCEFSSPTLSDCIIRDCGAEVGGGLGAVGAEPMMVNCTIEQCLAGGLGGAKSGGRGAALGLVGFSNATITNCLVRDNAGSANGLGAGLYVWQSSAVVAGCTFSGNTASGSLRGGGAYCGGTTTDVTFRNCIFARNQADAGAALYTDWTFDGSLSAALRSQRCRVSIVNCTIAQNQIVGSLSSLFAAAVYAGSTDVSLVSSILWGNTGKALSIVDAPSKSPVTFCDVQGGYAGTGNINQDPFFAAAERDDYHLKSQYGRYDPQSARWVTDSVHSPCIDAGDPSASMSEEPAPNGSRINMGAFGGTRQASYGPEHFIYHVDGLAGRDWSSGLSRTNAFATIQKAIDVARDGDTVLVWPGVYRERLIFSRKAITVQSAADAAVLTTPSAPKNDYAVSFFYAESSRSILANFVITGCGEGAIYCDGASPTLRNLTLVGNSFGILAYNGADPNIINSILWSNEGGDLFQCKARYSDIQQQSDPDKQAGNIKAEPQFADPERGDYHLKSRAGRYVPQMDTWTTDKVTSPCIDAGDPREDPRGERLPNGGRVNMGAYGGTPYASLSG
jgi:hypothetical protein